MTFACPSRPPARPSQPRRLAWAFANIPALLLGCGILFTLSVPGLARDHYLAPPDSASATADGSASAPWRSWKQIRQTGGLAAGDRILLQAGRYPGIHLKGWHYDPPVSIIPAPGAEGQVETSGLLLSNSSGLAIRGLGVWHDTPGAGGNGNRFLVQTKSDSHDIVLEALDIRGGPDAESYFDWTAEDWLTRWRTRGAKVGGTNNVLRDSTLTAVAIGIGSGGKNNLIENNWVRGFSMDGLRGFGTGTHFIGNRVQDNFKVDGNHDDGFQSWAPKKGGEGPRGLVLSGNTIIEWTGPEDHPLRSPMHGIALFDGPYRDWVIENNLVAVSHGHGMALKAVHNFRVVNNTMIRLDGSPDKRPWLVLSGGKKGDGPSSGVLLANNIAMSLRIEDSAYLDPRSTNNVRMRYPARHFSGLLTQEYRIKPDSPMARAADPGVAPANDIDGHPRGAQPSLGAQEAR